jgi:hypothetical protein
LFLFVFLGHCVTSFNGGPQAFDLAYYSALFFAQGAAVTPLGLDEATFLQPVAIGNNALPPPWEGRVIGRPNAHTALLRHGAASLRPCSNPPLPYPLEKFSSLQM